MRIEEFRTTGNKVGALKRKLKIKATDPIEPGTLISKANEMKAASGKKLTKKDVAIMGLV